MFPYKSMGTRTITVIEATRCLLYFHEKARRVKFVFCCCCCICRFSTRSRVAAGPTRSRIWLHRWRLRRLLAFHTLVGYCCCCCCCGLDDCRVTRTSIRSVTTKRKRLVVDFGLFVPKDSEGKKRSRGNSNTQKKNKRQTRWLNE